MRVWAQREWALLALVALLCAVPALVWAEQAPLSLHEPPRALVYFGVRASCKVALVLAATLPIEPRLAAG